MGLSSISKKFLCAGIILLAMGFITQEGYASDMQPFLYLPFSSKYYKTYTISEGWRYSGCTGYLNTIGTGEYFIHGLKNHSAIDYALPYGTPVFAPIDGYLIASYHNAFLKKNGYFTLLNGIQLHYGLGWYVQIWNPMNNIFVILGHLSSIDEVLPVSPPYPTRGKKTVSRRDPTGVTTDTGLLQEMIKNPKKYPGIILVHRGQRIGTVGVSGIEWDNIMQSKIEIPRKSVPQTDISRDEPHLHFEVFTIVDTKKQFIDPYNIYSDYRAYPDSNTKKGNLVGSLFVQTTKGRIRFASEK